LEKSHLINLIDIVLHHFWPTRTSLLKAFPSNLLSVKDTLSIYLIKFLYRLLTNLKQIQNISEEIESSQLELDSIISEQVYKLEKYEIKIVDNFLKV